LGMYERRIEHSLYRTMGELQRLRLLRELKLPEEEPTPEPAKPAGDERSCETKPISHGTHTETPAGNRTSGADKGRSCLTTGVGLGIIPHSKGRKDRRMGLPGPAVPAAFLAERTLKWPNRAL